MLDRYSSLGISYSQLVSSVDCLCVQSVQRRSVLYLAPVALAVVDRVAVVRWAQLAFLNIEHFEISVIGRDRQAPPRSLDSKVSIVDNPFDYRGFFLFYLCF